MSKTFTVGFSWHPDMRRVGPLLCEMHDYSVDTLGPVPPGLLEAHYAAAAGQTIAVDVTVHPDGSYTFALPPP
jgi:hypothetical protein